MLLFGVYFSSEVVLDLHHIIGNCKMVVRDEDEGCELGSFKKTLHQTCAYFSPNSKRWPFSSCLQFKLTKGPAMVIKDIENAK